MWKILMKDFDLGEPTSLSTVFISVALKANVRQAKILWTITEICLIPEFPQE